MKRMKIITGIHYLLSCISWIWGLLVLVFNLWGRWQAWHLAGFGFYFYFAIPLIAGIVALLDSYSHTDPSVQKKYTPRNGIVLIITIVMTVLTFTVFGSWFW